MKCRVLLVAAVVGCMGLLAAARGNAQEVEATVTVNLDLLPVALQDEVAGFGEEMERYINSNQWTDLDWEGEKVKMNINVVFTEGSANGYYSAKLLLGSQRTLYGSGNLSPVFKILDDQWQFPYVRNQPMYQDRNSYDELTGLIDFYVYIALGLDLDTYAKYGGTSMYETALDLARRGEVRSNSDGWTTQATPGSFSRFNIINELTNIRFRPIREYLYNYHYNGLDLLDGDRKAALDSINNHLSDLVLAIDRLVERSALLRVINEAKYMEYAELFTGYPDKSVWRKFLYIDPGHQLYYEEARDR